MWTRYNAYLETPPELKVAWRDRETGARGWLVINELRGGAAGGGTRMRVGANPREVGYLAKVMQLKFALAGPPIGGAKSGIDFDPRDPRKREVLRRWFRSIRPYLRDHYGTGGDLNVDEVDEVTPLIRELGLEHPQGGVIRGHLAPDAARFARLIDRMDRGVEAPLDGELGVPGVDLCVADMVTGYGVARAVIHYFEGLGRPVRDARVVVEGFGNVGAAAALYLARSGARIVAIADIDKALLSPDGLDGPAVAALIEAGPDRLLPDDPRCRYGTDRDAYFGVPADVFICAAASGTLTEPRLDQLEAAGTRVVAAGANLPFPEAEPGSMRVHQHADERFAVLPDFVVNLGMARAFSYFMEDGAEPRAGPAFAAVDATIHGAVDEMLDRTACPDHGLMAATLGLALDRIGAP
ncbi:MAG: Glu/Leu/Phe/Val dehydrogenase dimerization domain-containing protein [Gemmatimonadota bacterium]